MIATFRRTSTARIQATEKVGELRLVLVDGTQPVKASNVNVFDELYCSFNNTNDITNTNTTINSSGITKNSEKVVDKDDENDQNMRKEGKDWFSGRTDNNHKVFFIPTSVPPSYTHIVDNTNANTNTTNTTNMNVVSDNSDNTDTANNSNNNMELVAPGVGDYVVMRITHVLGKTIYGVPVSLSTISEYSQYE